MKWDGLVLVEKLIMYFGVEEVYNRGVGGKLNREVWESLMVWVVDILMKGLLRVRFYVIFV